MACLVHPRGGDDGGQSLLLPFGSPVFDGSDGVRTQAHLLDAEFQFHFSALVLRLWDVLDVLTSLLNERPSGVVLARDR